MKVFYQIFESSISEDYVTRHVFMDFLVLADEEGVVDKTLSAISRITNVPIEIVEMAVHKLCSPDKNSRSEEEDGRRLMMIDSHRDWGWKIVNYSKYRAMRDEEARRLSNRSYKREQRAKEKSKVLSTLHNVQDNTGMSASVSTCPQMSAQAEAEAEADTESTPPTESYSQTPILSAVADASSADAEGFLFPSPPLEILSSEKKNRPCSVVEERKRWFLEFWQVVWLKTAKGAALKAWLKAATTREMADTIIAAAKVQAPLLREDASRYDHSLIHPATWLNQGRWEDELNMPLPVRVRETASERNGRLREEKFVQRMVDDGLIDPARSQKGD